MIKYQKWAEAKNRIYDSIDRFHFAGACELFILMLYMLYLSYYHAIVERTIIECVISICSIPIVHMCILKIMIHYFRPFCYEGVEHDLNITNTIIINRI